MPSAAKCRDQSQISFHQIVWLSPGKFISGNDEHDMMLVLPVINHPEERCKSHVQAAGQMKNPKEWRFLSFGILNGENQEIAKSFQLFFFQAPEWQLQGGRFGATHLIFFLDWQSSMKIYMSKTDQYGHITWRWRHSYSSFRWSALGCINTITESYCKFETNCKRIPRSEIQKQTLKNVKVAIQFA